MMNLEFHLSGTMPCCLPCGDRTCLFNYLGLCQDNSPCEYREKPRGENEKPEPNDKEVSA